MPIYAGMHKPTFQTCPMSAHECTRLKCTRLFPSLKEIRLSSSSTPSLPDPLRVRRLWQMSEPNVQHLQLIDLVLRQRNGAEGRDPQQRRELCVRTSCSGSGDIPCVPQPRPRGAHCMEEKQRELLPTPFPDMNKSRARNKDFTKFGKFYNYVLAKGDF